MFIRARDQGVLRSLNDLEAEIFEYALKKKYGESKFWALREQPGAKAHNRKHSSTRP
jgi:hypothetical protein